MQHYLPLSNGRTWANRAQAGSISPPGEKRARTSAVFEEMTFLWRR